MSPIAYALAGMLTLVAVTWGYGLLLPSEVNGSATATCQVQPMELRQVVLDVRSQTAWRNKVKRVEVLPDGSWTETLESGQTTHFEWVEIGDHHARMVFSSPSGYEGTWAGTWRQVRKGHTQLEVTETVKTASPFTRVISRWLFDPTEFAQTYLRELCAEAERRYAVNRPQ